ncbi:MAG TPA: ABC transporter ATP-binding protein [Clostridia bacterium]|nr:ABC transporter ATP-binding protein [Clostridia bacterium]
MKLQVASASFSYEPNDKNARIILNDISFSISSGEILSILGPNGAGKTTLLRCIMGFLRWSGGSSTIDGEDIALIEQRRLWRKIAYVPQAKGKATGMSVASMVMLGRSSRIGVFSKPSDKDYMAVDEVMARLNLSELKHRRCDEISGGELQMALIGRALAAEPECIILDEPESNLDFRNQLIVLNTLEELKAAGMACIFNTHYPDHALRIADKALLLDKEGNSLFGAANEVITESAIASSFKVQSVISCVKAGQKEYRSITPIAILSACRKTPGLLRGGSPLS